MCGVTPMCEGAGVLDQTEHGVGGYILHEPLWGGGGSNNSKGSLPQERGLARAKGMETLICTPFAPASCEWDATTGMLSVCLGLGSGSSMQVHSGASQAIS